MYLEANFDGSYGHGISAWGFIVKDKEGHTIHTASGRLRGHGGNSAVAEYEALYQAMLWVSRNHPEAEVVFHGDSRLVIDQMTGAAKVRKGLYLPYHRKAWALAMPQIVAKRWSFSWVARALNSEADKLSAYRF
jgi:ribonuclease H / adenosylcobalamin/alpha-ribazole phosphatase